MEGCPPGSPYHLRRHPLCALLRFWRIHMLVQFPVPTYSDRLLYSRVGSMLCTKNLLKYSTSFWLGGSFRKLSTHTSITCCTSSVCVKYSFCPFFAPRYLRGGCCGSLACGWGFWGYSRVFCFISLMSSGTIFWLFPVTLIIWLVSIQNIAIFWPSLVSFHKY